ncbi:Glutathionyl-hydroquinone reductase YqjG [Labrenzia sp. THAF191b]|uniref:glutathione S-transferase family protein n=1 Tax=unclassified Labrenzia TaxID=2648686 RepID=UPI001268D31D|nr:MULTISPECIES: glutathione S-transferase family protein [unclassified Labrenzia]QFS98401.1 Glutathionyl-hydroquinone reductase YqjG [Labrenzia sp. THAF191b]QFT04715.1 Glutathionyl-hydroquinone reductase YqjG [Labrenzia sp. THAF191a]QFT16259.1 Glutathionyl-hydroquinone reductase YqjG [Labrenzia sp. THAF187b]
MGLLVDGVWKDKWYDTKSTGGRFVRKDAAFRNWITADGTAGPTGNGGFKAEADRYHLFVSFACPWAHRTLVFRKLKKLEDLISVSAVQPLMLENGWEFPEIDPLTGAKYAWHVYTKADPHYSGRATVPILWDKHQNTIVSNESSEIIRMFNSAFNDLTGSHLDFYPTALRTEIDSINERVYHAVNNGVYKSGFATTQEAYEEAVTELFKALDELEDRLSRQRYLVGDQLTEADWRLFTTLVRFDAVYVGHFKCNIRRIDDYPNLSNYLRELYQVPGVADTVDMTTIKQHYYGSHESVNPTRIVPVGPALDFTHPHDRERFKAAA